MKKLYVVRSVDLMNVCYSDNAFATKKEAKEYKSSLTKSVYDKDILIEVEVSNEEYEIILNEYHHGILYDIIQEKINEVKVS